MPKQSYLRQKSANITLSSFRIHVTYFEKVLEEMPKHNKATATASINYSYPFLSSIMHVLSFIKVVILDSALQIWQFHIIKSSI